MTSRKGRGGSSPNKFKIVIVTTIKIEKKRRRGRNVHACSLIAKFDLISILLTRTCTPEQVEGVWSMALIRVNMWAIWFSECQLLCHPLLTQWSMPTISTKCCIISQMEQKFGHLTYVCFFFSYDLESVTYSIRLSFQLCRTITAAVGSMWSETIRSLKCRATNETLLRKNKQFQYSKWRTFREFF